MELNDFSSIIEIGVTLNIAFVAIEYVKSYTKILCNQVFKLQHCIESSFNECLKVLVDEETLAHIQPNKIGDNKNTNNLIEKAKRTREILKKDIDTEKSKFGERIEGVCEAKNVSAISLWLFFYGLTGLFLCGLSIDITSKHLFWGILTLSTALYAIIGWLTKPNNKAVWRDYSTLRHSIMWYCILLIADVVLTVCLRDCAIVIMPYVWPISLFLGLGLMYSNFIASVVKVWSKAGEIRKEIVSASENLKVKCSELQKDVDKLISVNELCAQLEVE